MGKLVVQVQERSPRSQLDKSLEQVLCTQVSYLLMRGKWTTHEVVMFGILRTGRGRIRLECDAKLLKESETGTNDGLLL